MKTRPVWLKVLLYLWVAPITLWCLPLALLAKWTGGGFAVHTGVLEVWGGKVGAWLERAYRYSGRGECIYVGACCFPLVYVLGVGFSQCQ